MTKNKKRTAVISTLCILLSVSNGISVFAAEIPPDQSSVSEPVVSVTLDTSTVTLSEKAKYHFLVKDNQDTENIQMEIVDPKVASVQLADANDSRGAKYELTANAEGSTKIRVTYQGKTAVMNVNVTPAPVPKGSITLDTSHYTMAPGDRYTIGMLLKDENGDSVNRHQIAALLANGTLKVSDSRTGSIVRLEKTSNGNFQVTGKKEGTAYVIYEIGGAKTTVRIDVQKGVKAYGNPTKTTQAANISVPKNKIIDAPLIYQTVKYPTGCESVSAVMALQYAGVNLSVDTFIDKYLPKSNFPFDPNLTFGGNPKSFHAFGCYAPVIKKALDKILSSKPYTAKVLSGVSLPELCSTYIDKDIPVILWATMGMSTPRRGDSWTYRGKTIQWIVPQHCLLLVGYDDTHYIFNDPQKHTLAYYKKSAVEKAYAGLFHQAIVIEPQSNE